jgi:hypothetical protein
LAVGSEEGVFRQSRPVVPFGQQSAKLEKRKCLGLSRIEGQVEAPVHLDRASDDHVRIRGG